MLRLKDIRLTGYPLIDNWEGKAGYVWRIAPDTPDEDLALTDFLRPSDIIRTTVQGDSVALTLPEGRWRILCFEKLPAGQTLPKRPVLQK